MRCPVCQHDNLAGAKFCIECGTRLERRCPVCSTAYQPGAKFCSECGTNLQESAGTPTPDSSSDLARYVPDELLRKIRAAQSGQAMRGERRTVTMLFADIEGSTAAAEHLDPEEWADIVNGAFGHLIEPVYRYEGTLARLQGDAILAFFGAPIAHEDDPVRAVRAGLDMLADVRDYIEEIEATKGIRIGVRVGINTGLVVVGEVGSDLRVEYTALGDAINVAARMEQTAEPGTVRVTSETLELLDDMFAIEAIGPVDVKGKSEPVMAHRIVGVNRSRGAERPDRTPLVGREAELEALDAAVRRLDDGLGAICTVIGEAGIGKSRLLAAMQERATARHSIAATWSDDAELAWVHGRARSYERTVPYATFADLLSGWWARERGDDCFDVVVDALEPALGRRDPDLAALLANIVGAALPDAQQRVIDAFSAPVLHERTTAAVGEYAEAEAGRRPLVIVLDDLHWADPLSLTLVEELMEVCEKVPLALVLVMRPNREDPAWRLIEVAGRDHARLLTAIELEPLAEAATDELLASLLGEHDLPIGLRKTILDRSDGNPLFVEEIVRSLGDAAERGALPASGAVEIPASLMGLLTARLDRLEEQTRAVAQVASVIGREFDIDTLTVVLEGSDHDESIRGLLQRGILEERRRVPVPTYSFRHPLIREAAYSTVLLRDRRDLHGRIARSLATSSPDSVEEIARHFVESGEPSAAFPYLIEAGQRAIRAMALSDAITHFMVALESPPADATGEQILAANGGLGEAYSLVPDLTKASAAFQSLLDYGKAMGRPELEVTALNRLGFSTAALSGDLDQAMGYLRQARALAESVGDEFGLAEYHMNACFITTMSGDIEGAVEHDSETARIGGLVGDPQIRLLGLVRQAANLTSLLQFEEGREIAAEGLAIAEELGNEDLAAVIRCNVLASIAFVTGDIEGARKLYDEQLPVLDRYANQYGAFSHTAHAELQLFLGNEEAALAEYGAVEHLGRSAGFGYALAAGLSGRAKVLARRGLPVDAETISEARHALEQPAGDFLASTVLADFGEVAMAAGDTAGARDDLARALATSSVTARMQRPRILFGLIRVALAEGQHQLASEHLEEARTFVTSHGLRSHEPQLAFLEGMLAAARGETETAAERFEAAVTSANELGCRPILDEATRQLAELSGGVGQPASAVHPSADA